MKFIIYKITNLVDGKIYVGKHQTEDLNDGYLGSGKLLRRALKKHDRKKFIKEILHVYETEQEMNDREKELVTEEFCKRKDTYNICEGGQGGWSYVNNKGSNNKTQQSRTSRNKRTKSLVSYYAEEHRSRPLIKRNHELGIYTHSYFGNRGDQEAISKLANSPEALAKKRSTWKTTNFQQGPNNSQFGMIWITDGLQSRKIRKSEFLPEGWRKGRVINSCP